MVNGTRRGRRRTRVSARVAHALVRRSARDRAPSARVIALAGQGSRYRRWLLVLCGSLAGAASACDFERMRQQPRFDPYEPSPYFANGTIMQHPPEGAVARDRVLGPEELVEGRSAGELVAQVPLPLDAALLTRGRDRYEIFCAPCHGVVGDGETKVSEDMRLRPPPALIDEPVSEYPPGRIYQAIVEGYGVMRSYRYELEVRDRWAVVAYVQALQMSQNARLTALPNEVRAAALQQLSHARAPGRRAE